MTKKKAVQTDTTPKLPVDEVEVTNHRLTLLSPSNFEPMEHGWIELAPINSAQGDKAQAAMVVRAKANNVDTTKMSDEDFLLFRYQQDREHAARLIVAWDEAYYGPLTTERAIEILETKRWIWVQVELALKNTRTFYKA
jgi:hypothetical protein